MQNYWKIEVQKFEKFWGKLWKPARVCAMARRNLEPENDFFWNQIWDFGEINFNLAQITNILKSILLTRACMGRAHMAGGGPSALARAGTIKISAICLYKILVMRANFEQNLKILNFLSNFKNYIYSAKQRDVASLSRCNFGGNYI